MGGNVDITVDIITEKLCIPQKKYDKVCDINQVDNFKTLQKEWL